MTDEEYRELLSRFRNIRAEERSYLDALKKRGARIAGVFCSFVPLEIPGCRRDLLCEPPKRGGEQHFTFRGGPSGKSLPLNPERIRGAFLSKELLHELFRARHRRDEL